MGMFAAISYFFICHYRHESLRCFRCTILVSLKQMQSTIEKTRHTVHHWHSRFSSLLLWIAIESEALLWLPSTFKFLKVMYRTLSKSSSKPTQAIQSITSNINYRTKILSIFAAEVCRQRLALCPKASRPNHGSICAAISYSN